MKTKRIGAAVVSAVAFLGLAQASPAIDGAAGSPQKAAYNLTHQQVCASSSTAEIFSGTLTAVNSQDKTFSVKDLFFTRNFNAASDCRVSMENKDDAGLNDLRPGQKVDVRYSEANGVWIAKNVAEHDMAYDGHILSINPQQRMMTMNGGLTVRTLAIAPDCAITVKGFKADDLKNLQVGDYVRVLYSEPEHALRTACRIDENSPAYTGTIQAVDGADRFIKVTGDRGEKKFNLGDSCPIVINDQLTGRMSDLRIGERVSLTYDNHDGVLVANRVTPVITVNTSAQQPAEAAQSARTAKSGMQPTTFYPY